MQLLECMTKYLAIAFLITGFLAVDAYGEVRAESSEFTCSKADTIRTQTVPIAAASICTGHGLKCVFSIRTGANGPSGVSCVKTGMFK